MLVVKQERIARGISQAKLARLADVNQSSMNRIENGKEPAYSGRGKRIASALGWQGDPADLFKEVKGDAPATCD